MIALLFALAGIVNPCVKSVNTVSKFWKPKTPKPLLCENKFIIHL